jgi:hypothetical protein
MQNLVLKHLEESVKESIPTRFPKKSKRVSKSAVTYSQKREYIVQAGTLKRELFIYNVDLEASI